MKHDETHTGIESIGETFRLDDPARRAAEIYPFRITPHVLGIARRSNAVARQFIPDGAELDDESGPPDPLQEEEAQPASCIIRRYPDRLILIASSVCAANCRFCTRKGRLTSNPQQREIAGALEYIRQNSGIRQVILSGGDPLTLPDDALGDLLDRLRAIPHVRVIRIHTRVPFASPRRITQSLCGLLRKAQPIHISIHFNHPDELSPYTSGACSALADAGIPLASQTVLLRGVNDDEHVMQELMEQLLELRVMPYYLHHPDGTRGTRHFDVSMSRGRQIIRHLLENCCGLAVPRYVRDTPGSMYKRPV